MSGNQRSVVILGDRQLWRHADWCDGAPLLVGCREEYHDLQGLIRPAGSLFDPVIPISVFIQIKHRDWSECAETSNERALHVQISALSCKSNSVRRVGQDLDKPRGK